MAKILGEDERMKPSDIRPGKKYRLITLHLPAQSVTRRVERIEGDQVVVIVNGKEVQASVEFFAAMAVEEVQ